MPNSIVRELKLVHVCPDEKFMDGAFHSFEIAFPGQNTFIVLKSPANPPLKYIKNVSAVVEVVQDENLISKLESQTVKADLIILYGLNYSTAKWVDQTKSPDKFLWMILGAELYQNPYIFKESLFGERTRQLNRKLGTKPNLQERLKNIYRQFRYNVPKIKEEEKLLQIKESISKINFFGSLFKEEIEMLKNNCILGQEAIFQHFSFYPIEYFTEGKVNNKVYGTNILLGNSASFTNNHLEAFNHLKELNLSGRKVITPLSYGDIRYAKKITQEGQKILGSSFKPLLNFMPMKEYNEVLFTCSIVVMNHYRQQGVGNILTSLWIGCKVYLSEKNLVFDYLKRIGCYVYSIETELRPENKQALEPLTVEQVEMNRQILKQNISEKILVEQLKEGILTYLKRKVIV